MLPLTAPILARSTVLPPWVVLPIAALALAELAEEPGCTGLLAYALSLAPVGGEAPLRQDHASVFLQVWLMIIVLIGMVVLLAGLDAIETLRLGVQSRRQMRRRLRENMERIVAERHRLRAQHDSE